MACCESGRRSGSWGGNSEDVWFYDTCDVDPWRLGAFLFFIVWKSEVNGAHDLFTPETLCCQVLHRGEEMTDGQRSCWQMSR